MMLIHIFLVFRFVDHLVLSCVLTIYVKSANSLYHRFQLWFYEREQILKS
jgi:hypothetical protein